MFQLVTRQILQLTLTIIALYRRVLSFLIMHVLCVRGFLHSILTPPPPYEDALVNIFYRNTHREQSRM